MKLKSTYLFLLTAFLVVALLLPHPVSAAKKRIRTSKKATSSGIAYSSAKLSRSTNSVVLTLLNLGSVNQVDYILSYTANGIFQGAGGSVTPTETTATRDLYFGTCSKGVCTPHTTIKNATLLVTTTLKSGGTHTKRYRIKV